MKKDLTNLFYLVGQEEQIIIFKVFQVNIMIMILGEEKNILKHFGNIIHMI